MPVHFLPLELNRNLKVWRYMKLSAFLALLQGAAYFPSVATLKLKDPLEGDLHPEPDWLIGKLRALSKSKFKELNQWLVSKGREWERRSLAVKDQDEFFTSRLLADIYIRELAKRRAIWCWIASNTESAGMWSIYGHGGVAVGTTLDALSQSLPNDRHFQIAQIRYAGREPNAPNRFNPESLGDDSRIHRPQLVKGTEYASENEVRVVTRCSSSEKGLLVDKISVDKLVQVVVISPLIPFKEAKAIEGQIANHRWKEKPDIHRSFLLGEENIDRDETTARIPELLGDGTVEAGLPPLMDTL
jgi:hypothetical protein